MTEKIPGVKGWASLAHTALYLKIPPHRPDGDVCVHQPFPSPVAMMIFTSFKIRAC